MMASLMRSVVYSYAPHAAYEAVSKVSAEKATQINELKVRFAAAGIE